MSQLASDAVVALRGWSDFLEEQMAALNNAILRGNGVFFRPQEGEAVFLVIDNAVNSGQVAEAVSYFARSNQWPKLTYSQLRLLLMRVFGARRLVQALIDQEVDVARCNPALPTNLADKPELIRWLLVDTWNAIDTESVKGIATEFVRARLQQSTKADRTGVIGLKRYTYGDQGRSIASG